MNPLISAASPGLMPPVFDPLSNRRSNNRQDSGDSLLYRTYDDYFNMEEDENAPPVSAISAKPTNSLNDSLTPLHYQPPEPEKLSVSTNSSAFFFVLSTSSPISPSHSETGFTPISPQKPGDIPEALSYLLPQPSNSLLEVINVTQSESFPTTVTESKEVSNRGRSSSKAEPPANVAATSEPVTSTTKRPSNRSRSRTRPGQFQLRDSNAPVPFSQVVINPPSPPASSVAEITVSPPSLPKRRPNPIQTHNPQSGITYPSRPLPQTPARTPQTPARATRTPPTTALRPRVREARSMEGLSSSSPKGPSGSASRGHVKGLSSPFPLPIQFDFASSSVPGSAVTPYSYF